MTLGRIFLFLAVADGMFTGGVFVPSFFGFHVMLYRVLLPVCVLILVYRSSFRTATADDQGLPVRGFLLFLVFWMSWAILSLLWVRNFDDALRQIYFMGSGVVLIVLMVAWCTSQVSLEKMTKLWLVVFALTIAVGLWEVATGQHLPGSGVLLSDAAYMRVMARMPTATFGNPNNFAFYIIMTLPVALAWWRYRLTGWSAAILGLVLSVSALTVVATTSRLGILGWVATALGSVAMWHGAKARLFRLPGLRTVAAAVLLFVAFSWTPAASQALEELRSVKNVLSSGLAKDARVILMRDSLDVLEKTNGLGVGAGNIETYLASYQYSRNSGILNPHGWWPELSANYGLVGLVGYSVFYLSLFFAMWRAHRQRRRDGADRTLVEGALVALSVYPIATFVPSSVVGMFFHWFLLGFCLAVLNNHRVSAGPTVQRLPAQAVIAQ